MSIVMIIFRKNKSQRFHSKETIVKDIRLLFLIVKITSSTYQIFTRQKKKVKRKKKERKKLSHQ